MGSIRHPAPRSVRCHGPRDGGGAGALLLSDGLGLGTRQEECLFDAPLTLLLTNSLWQHATWRHLGPGGQRLTLRIGADGLHVAGEAYGLRVAWASVDRLAFERGHLVMTYLAGRGVAVPVGAFADEAALPAFVRAAVASKAAAG